MSTSKFFQRILAKVSQLLADAVSRLKLTQPIISSDCTVAGNWVGMLMSNTIHAFGATAFHDLQGFETLKTVEIIGYYCQWMTVLLNN